MASLHRQPGKPNWFCAYTVAGNRRFRSTKTTDKKQAWQICNTWAKASALGGKLTPEGARNVIAAGVADVLMATGQTLPSATIRDWCKRWLEFKEVESEPRTHERYEISIRRFLNYLGSKADRDLTALTTDELIRFRDQTAKTLSTSSCNVEIKILRACLSTAVRQDLIEKNVAKNVPALKQRGEHKRRAFTLEEIQKVLEVCDARGGEWRGLVLTAVYTGQRLGDIARLTWQDGTLDLFISGVDAILAPTFGIKLALYNMIRLQSEGAVETTVAQNLLKNLLGIYKGGNTIKTYVMPLGEVVQSDVKFSLLTSAAFTNDIANEGDPTGKTYHIQAEARTRSTLGNFTAVATVNSFKRCGTKCWTATGTFVVKDRYDFNYDPREAQRALTDYVNQRDGGPYEKRSRDAELKTVIMSRVVAKGWGEEFDVTSDKVPFMQKHDDSFARINK